MSKNYYLDHWEVMLRARAIEGIKQCDFNLYYPAAGQKLKLVGVQDESWEQWRKLGFDEHSLVTDPLFVDPQNGDYRLRSDSPAHKLGFKPIPFEQIGPRSKK